MTTTTAMATTDAWRRPLEGFSAPTPIFFARRPPEPDVFDGNRVSRTASIPAPATAALRAFGRRHDLSVETILRGAWALLLGRYSGEKDVVFGVAGTPFGGVLPLRVPVLPEAITLPRLRIHRDLEAAVRE